MFTHLIAFVAGALVAAIILFHFANKHRQAPEEESRGPLLTIFTEEEGSAPIAKLEEGDEALAWAGARLARIMRENVRDRSKYYQAPEHPAFTYRASLIFLLTKLIEDGEVDLWEAQRQLKEEVGGSFNPPGFGQACGELFDSVQVGTGTAVV